MPRWLMEGREKHEQIALLMLAAGLWCVTHPYVGMFEHDARVYTLLVWHWLSPEAYARDVFFLFGSQDRYSVFTPIYATLAESVGLSNAAMLVTALGGALWVSAAVLVARGLLYDRRLQAFAVLCCVMWSLNYSPNGATFRLNEAFPTARIIAFPLGALALGLALHQRFWAAVVLAAAASALHPLLGIWPLALIIAQRMSDRMVVLAAILAIGLMTAMSLLGVGALQRMDPSWESIIRNSSVDVFVGLLGNARLNETLAWLSLLLWAGRLAPDPVCRWYRLGAAIGASGFLLAQTTSYFYPAILLVQAQSWRAMWIVVFLGMFALAQVLGIAWRGQYRIWWAIGGLLLVIAGDWCGVILFGSCALFHPVVWAHAVTISRRVHSHAYRFAPLLLGGLLLAVLPGYSHSAFGVLPVLAAAWMCSTPPQGNRDEALSVIAAKAVLMSLLFATGLRAWQIGSFMHDHLAQLPLYPKGRPAIVFVGKGYYSRDLVQNDPWLRVQPWVFVSRGKDADIEVAEEILPGGCIYADGQNGWTYAVPEGLSPPPSSGISKRSPC